MTERIWKPRDWLDERFQLDALIGKGSFGEVWRATDARTNDEVAVKLLFQRFHSDAQILARFRQEADILLQLSHPNIARAVARSADDDEEQAYLAMEMVHGLSLDQQFNQHSKAQSKLSASGVLWIVRGIANAVDHAHEHHVVHRDLKPKNVMLGRSGEEPFLKVLDFGLAKVLVGGQMDPTTAGRLVGSVLYVAPEQVRSRPVDARADVFALATMTFELFSFRRAWAVRNEGGRLPWHQSLPKGSANGHVSVLKRILSAPRPSLRPYRPDLPAELDEILHAGMAIDPADRPLTACEFADALERVLA